MNYEDKLKEILLPVLGIESVDEISSEAALVNDLGAESIDFVEILYMIETEIGVKINIQEIILTDYMSDSTTSREESISAEIAERLNKDFGTDRFKEGQSIRDLFESFTVKDFATIIERKMEEESSKE